METQEAVGRFDQLLLFLNFLRGMETRPSSAIRPRTHGFLNFLRGMETAASQGKRVLMIDFLNFLRGMETW